MGAHFTKSTFHIRKNMQITHSPIKSIIVIDSNTFKQWSAIYGPINYALLNNSRPLRNNDRIDISLEISPKRIFVGYYPDSNAKKNNQQKPQQKHVIFHTLFSCAWTAFTLTLFPQAVSKLSLGFRLLYISRQQQLVQCHKKARLHRAFTLPIDDGCKRFLHSNIQKNANAFALYKRHLQGMCVLSNWCLHYHVKLHMLVGFLTSE